MAKLAMHCAAFYHDLCARRPRTFLAVGILVVVATLGSSWVARQWVILGEEERARGVLEQYGAVVDIDATSDFRKQRIDLRQLRFGRLYAPVNGVHATQITIDRRFWEQLKSFRYLESLDLENCRLDFIADFDRPGFPGLKSLTLSATPVPPETLQSLSRLTQLSLLTFDGSGLTGDWMLALSGLPRLEVLTIGNGDLRGENSSALSRMKQIELLVLDRCRVDSKLCPALGKLGNLKFLAINCATFADDEARQIPLIKGLFQLSLSGTAVTDEGMASLEKLRELRWLDVSGTSVGDAGIAHLAKSPKLMEVIADGTRITNSCLRDLAASPSLMQVDLRGTKVSPSAPAFAGVLDGDVWFPSELKRRNWTGVPAEFRGW